MEIEYKLTHKNFKADVEFDPLNKLFYGKIAEIKDLVSFEGSTLVELRLAFEEAVNDYIKTHKNISQENNNNNNRCNLWNTASKFATKYDLPFELKLKDIYLPAYCPIIDTIELKPKSRHMHTPVIRPKVWEKGFIPGNIIVTSKAAKQKYYKKKGDKYTWTITLPE